MRLGLGLLRRAGVAVEEGGPSERWCCRDSGGLAHTLGRLYSGIGSKSNKRSADGEPVQDDASPCAAVKVGVFDFVFRKVVHFVTRKGLDCVEVDAVNAYYQILDAEPGDDVPGIIRISAEQGAQGYPRAAPDQRARKELV